jgi:hypothetical protein
MKRFAAAQCAFLLLFTIQTFGQQPRARQDALLDAAARSMGVSSRPSGPVPKRADGKPDLSGVWLGGGPNGSIEDGLAPGETVPLRPEARKLKASRLAKDEPFSNCLPTGVPRVSRLPWRIVQTPTHIFFLFEADSWRQIFMDGRPHPAPDARNPTWYGHSIGRWDGDTLVVDSVGFNDRAWLDIVGHPRTERMHVVERYRRLDLGTIENEITIDDPGPYTRPFKVTFWARLVPGIELMEYICNENNSVPARLQGPAEAVRDNPR